MRIINIIVIGALLACVVLGLVWVSHWPAATPIGMASNTTQSATPALRLGLVPERDVFAQRRAYRELADYLETTAGLRTEVVTLNSYRAVLDDFHEQQIDAAFLGSLVAVLAVDREGAQTVIKSEHPGAISTYHGVVFVRDDSPIRTVAELAGHSLGIVRTTTGGNVFPLWLLLQNDMLAPPRAPHMVWVGTHDDVVNQVELGGVDAGAVKDMRLDAYEQAHPTTKFRRLATSQAVPENGLVIRRDYPPAQRAALVQALLGMAHDPAGAHVLAALGLTRFLPCDIGEYHVVFDIVEQLGPAWKELGIAGPPPKRPMPKE